MYDKLVFFLFYGFIHFWHSDILNEIDIFCGFEKAYHIVKKGIPHGQKIYQMVMICPYIPHDIPNAIACGMLPTMA